LRVVSVERTFRCVDFVACRPCSVMWWCNVLLVRIWPVTTHRADTEFSSYRLSRFMK
jgi:hypothetical protein